MFRDCSVKQELSTTDTNLFEIWSFHGSENLNCGSPGFDAVPCSHVVVIIVSAEPVVSIVKVPSKFVLAILYLIGFGGHSFKYESVFAELYTVTAHVLFI
jgi:hypothetical protein